jgi:hypothetical protein
VEFCRGPTSRHRCLSIAVSVGTSDLKGVYPPAYGAGAEGQSTSSFANKGIPWEPFGTIANNTNNGIGSGLHAGGPTQYAFDATITFHAAAVPGRSSALDTRSHDGFGWTSCRDVAATDLPLPDNSTGATLREDRLRAVFRCVYHADTPPREGDQAGLDVGLLMVYCLEGNRDPSGLIYTQHGFSPHNSLCGPAILLVTGLDAMQNKPPAAVSRDFGAKE